MEAKYFIILFGVVNVVYDDNEFPYKHILLPKKVVQEDEKPNINKIPYPFRENNENQFFARRIKRYGRKGKVVLDCLLRLVYTVYYLCLIH